MANADTRGITDSITFAHTQLQRARLDGGCEQIQFWARRLDQLLDELTESRHSPVSTSNPQQNPIS